MDLSLQSFYFLTSQPPALFLHLIFRHFSPPPFFISEIIRFFPFTGTNPLRWINYFTSGTELSHCEQHIAGINAHQLAKLCAFSKWVAGFWGNTDLYRPLRDCSVEKWVSKSTVLTKLEDCFTLKMRCQLKILGVILSIKVSSFFINIKSKTLKYDLSAKMCSIACCHVALICIYIDSPADLKGESSEHSIYVSDRCAFNCGLKYISSM